MAARTSLRSRLLAAIVLVTVGTLVLSAGLTFVVTEVAARRRAFSSAQADLERRAPDTAQAVIDVQNEFAKAQRSPGTTGTTAPANAPRAAVRKLLQGTLRLTDGTLVYVTPQGRIVEEPGAGGSARPLQATDLPEGVTPQDLDVAALQDGQQLSGRSGRFVFVAQPLPKPTGGGGAVPVVVLSRKVEYQPIGAAGGVFIVVALLTLGVAVLVSVWLARRLTSPLKRMDATAQAIAGGDLSARVDLGSHPNDEMADLARALNGMAERLEAARGQERAFLLSVSHDLRTPLTSIRGYADAIIDGTVEGSNDRIRAATVIQAEALRLERLVADLLDLARIDAHEFSLRPHPCDAGAIVRTTVAGFNPAADEVGVALTCDPPALTADVDAQRLGQIVANLTENALKYANSRVIVQAVAHGDMLAIAVDDDGPGIEVAEIDHVFDRLYTSRTSPGRKVGTGLGLAIVRELSAAMGGSVRAERLEPHGTRITVGLPVLTTVTAMGAPITQP